MSSDEEDYMSEAFLIKSVPDIRPGLIKNRQIQRDIEVNAKKVKLDNEIRGQQKPVKLLENERRTEGLENALSSDNKGFAMLTKMGYKHGQAIGKSSQGIIEPIGINIKNDRGGFGRELALKRLAEHKLEIRTKRLKHKQYNESVTTEEFRKRKIQESEQKQNDIQLGRCQRACEKLDLNENIKKPAMLWFWPQRKQTNEDSDDDNKDNEEHHDSDEEDFIEYDTIEKLEMLTNYLRTTYFYCHWCGVEYKDVIDMNNDCPGPDKDDH